MTHSSTHTAERKYSNMIHIDRVSEACYDSGVEVHQAPFRIEAGLFFYPLGVVNMGMHIMRNPRYMTKKEIYNDIRYKRARAACLARAGNKCEECRRYGRSVDATTAHHVKPVEQYPELAFDASNLRAICAACHSKEHPEKGGNRGRKG